MLAPLRRLMAGRTTLMISHNLLTVTDADRIVFLEDGRIGVGAHADLLTRSPGTPASTGCTIPAPTQPAPTPPAPVPGRGRSGATTGPRLEGAAPPAAHPAAHRADWFDPDAADPPTVRLRVAARRLPATEGTAPPFRTAPPVPGPPHSRRTEPLSAATASSGLRRRSEGHAQAAPVRWNRGDLARAVGDRRARHRPRRPRRPPPRRPHRRGPVHRLRHPGLPRPVVAAADPDDLHRVRLRPGGSAPLLGTQPCRLGAHGRALPNQATGALPRGRGGPPRGDHAERRRAAPGRRQRGRDRPARARRGRRLPRMPPSQRPRGAAAAVDRAEPRLHRGRGTQVETAPDGDAVLAEVEGFRLAGCTAAAGC